MKFLSTDKFYQGLDKDEFLRGFESFRKLLSRKSYTGIKMLASSLHQAVKEYGSGVEADAMQEMLAQVRFDPEFIDDSWIDAMELQAKNFIIECMPRKIPKPIKKSMIADQRGTIGSLKGIVSSLETEKIVKKKEYSKVQSNKGKKKKGKVMWFTEAMITIIKYLSLTEPTVNNVITRLDELEQIDIDEIETRLKNVDLNHYDGGLAWLSVQREPQLNTHTRPDNCLLRQRRMLIMVSGVNGSSLIVPLLNEQPENICSCQNGR